MEFCGSHLVVEFCECRNAELLDDVQQIEQVLQEGLKAVGFTLVTLSSHKFTPIGVTSFAIISESHVAIHTYPETGHASIDIFHCSNEAFPLFQLMDFLQYYFKPCQCLHVELRRGRRLKVVENFNYSGVA
jgi:S-adenosylmethionine decarboxylase